jgi:SOS-response transcriptional repressor LexA
MSDLSICLNSNAAATAEQPVAAIHPRISLDDLLIPHPAKTLLVRCPNDSQAAQGFHRGDLLVIDQSQSPCTGQWVIKIINDEISVHQFDDHSLHSANLNTDILGVITYRIGKLP